jgi:hypothetical protein
MLYRDGIVYLTIIVAWKSERLSTIDAFVGFPNLINILIRDTEYRLLLLSIFNLLLKYIAISHRLLK